jgi:hypothetical protein
MCGEFQQEKYEGKSNLEIWVSMGKIMLKIGLNREVIRIWAEFKRRRVG